MPTYLVAADTGPNGETEYIGFGSQQEAQDFIDKYPQFHPRMVKTRIIWPGQSE